jgi:hypothetical protein
MTKTGGSAQTTAPGHAPQHTSSHRGDWVSINHLATYTLKYSNSQEHTSDYEPEDELMRSTTNVSSVIRIPLSKYQIYQHHLTPNTLSSILVVKQITEKDAGIYKCFASNEVGNRSVEFRLHVDSSVEGEAVDSGEQQRQKSVGSKSKKNPYSVERPKNYKSKFAKSKANTGAELTDSGETSKALEDEDYSISSASRRTDQWAATSSSLLLCFNLVVVSLWF